MVALKRSSACLTVGAILGLSPHALGIALAPHEVAQRRQFYAPQRWSLRRGSFIRCSSGNEPMRLRIAKDDAYEQLVREAWEKDVRCSGKSLIHQPLTYSEDDVTMHARLVQPERPNGCGVVIVHTAVGPHDVFLYWKAEALASLGYTVLIADMFGDDAGHGWDLEWSVKARQPLAENRGLLRRRMRSAVQALQARADVEKGKIAAIGYCFGGRAVLDLARLGKESCVKAVVSFHGILDDGALRSADMSAEVGGPRVLICHGDSDPFVDSESRAACEAQLRRCGARWDMLVFGGVRHGFTNPAQALNKNPAFGFDARAAEKSWKAMLDLFEEAFEMRG